MVYIVAQFTVNVKQRRPATDQAGHWDSYLGLILQVFATDDHLVIVTDYATAGSLSTHIESEGAIPEQTAKDFFRQLADGITYCHR